MRKDTIVSTIFERFMTEKSVRYVILGHLFLLQRTVWRIDVRNTWPTAYIILQKYAYMIYNNRNHGEGHSSSGKSDLTSAVNAQFAMQMHNMKTLNKVKMI